MSRTTVVAIAVVLLAAGCGAQGEVVNNRPAMTESQALARIAQLVDGTVSVIQPKPHLELYRPSLDSRPCSASGEGGPEDGVVISRGYYLNGVPKEQLKEVSEKIRLYWEQQGHVIETASETGINIGARSRPDDFIMALFRTNENVLGVGITSTCVLAQKTPRPSDG
ncbi:hypothetical protein Skr01_30650 [Sphaerisporangium krabiense]|uniref:LppA-like lipoprotein n=1 Tax=Sphaerisporangium krabiense TaxID=763782 RepID=A0A7W8Z1F8_9ACTN|nr:hypothetical protein [Sphaerisporangium krabiense]MBB5625684.1 hypothetical protein [Sphaerisporangium krabiense]GII62980.1 hypothetical protein Skr01_30650 [Sphaerisporangium krabiense]